MEKILVCNLLYIVIDYWRSLVEDMCYPAWFEGNSLSDQILSSNLMSPKCSKCINPLTLNSSEMLRDNAQSLSYRLKNLKVKKWERMER